MFHLLNTPQDLSERNKSRLSLKVTKCFEFVELIVLLSSVELILDTDLSVTNKNTHTLAC
jgi:hypothetical protein